MRLSRDIRAIHAVDAFNLKAYTAYATAIKVLATYSAIL